MFQDPKTLNVAPQCWAIAAEEAKAYFMRQKTAAHWRRMAAAPERVESQR